MAHMRFGRRLLEIEDEGDRRLALCTLMIGEEFGALRAGIYRIPAKGPLDRAGADRRGRPGHRSRGGRGGGAVPPGSQAARGGAGWRYALALAYRPTGVDGVEWTSVACPLRQTSQFMEVLHAVVGPEQPAEGWLAMATLVSEELGQAEMAWEARMREAEHVALQRELERARGGAVGPGAPATPWPGGWTLRWASSPCRGVAGDYVDVLEVGDDRTLLVVADVCGKGMQAALIAAAVRTFVHAVSGSGDLEEMVTRLNRHLLKTLPQASFVTFAAALVDTATGRLGVRQCRPSPAPAGGLRQRRTPACREAPAHWGVSDTSFTTEELHWRPGRWLAFYTDGLIEARDPSGHMVGIDGLSSLPPRAPRPTPRRSRPPRAQPPPPRPERPHRRGRLDPPARPAPVTGGCDDRPGLRAFDRINRIGRMDRMKNLMFLAE